MRKKREREKKGNFLLRLLKTCTYILTRTINISQENKRCIVLNYDRSKMNRGLSSQTQTFIVRMYNLRGGHQYLLLNFEGWTWNLDYTVNVVIYYSLTDFGCHTLCNTQSVSKIILPLYYIHLNMVLRHFKKFFSAEKFFFSTQTRVLNGALQTIQLSTSIILLTMYM